MYHVSTVCGQCAFGNSPLSTHTATVLTPGGGADGVTVSSAFARFSASAIRKNNGAAASTPMNAGFPCPAKSPIHTTSTYGPNTPAVHASRNPHDVPVFHATGHRVRTG